MVTVSLIWFIKKYGYDIKSDGYIIAFSDEEINKIVSDKLGMVGLKDIEHLKPSPEIFNEINKAFEKCGIETLSPVYEYLGGKYNYEIIRLARIFLMWAI